MVSKSYLSCQGLSSVLWSATEELHKKLWESMAETDDPKWPNDIPCCRSSYPVYKLGEVTLQGSVVTWRLAELVVKIVLCITCFSQLAFSTYFFTAFTINHYYYYLHHHPSSPHHHHLCFVLLFLIIKLFLSWPMSFTLFLILLPIPSWRKWSE